MSRTVLVTGAAGFIGAALSQRLLQQGDRVIGLDNLNSYYDPALKQARLANIATMAPAGAASSMLAEIDSVLSVIGSTRAELGALQNRFQSTIRNLSNISEIIFIL